MSPFVSGWTTCKKKCNELQIKLCILRCVSAKCHLFVLYKNFSFWSQISVVHTSQVAMSIDSGFIPVQEMVWLRRVKTIVCLWLRVWRRVEDDDVGGIKVLVSELWNENQEVIVGEVANFATYAFVLIIVGTKQVHSPSCVYFSVFRLRVIFSCSSALAKPRSLLRLRKISHFYF